MAKRIILFGGAPGSGKSSISENISSTYGDIEHLSTGDHIRNISTGKETSRYYSDILENTSQLSRSIKLPTNLVCSIIEEYMQEKSIANNIIIDGYPRYPEQGDQFFSAIHKLGAVAVAAVYLNISKETAMSRMVKRGSRDGEQDIDVKFAEKRYESFIETYSQTLEMIKGYNVPIYKISTEGPIEDNAKEVISHIKPHLSIDQKH